MATQKRKSAAKSSARVTTSRKASSIVIKKLAVPKKARRSADTGKNDVRGLRESLGLSRKVFSRLSQFSERAIADWESGESLGGASRQRMTELQRLQHALESVLEPDYIGTWLQAPNESFEGLKPLEVIERGQIDRIWRMVHLLESGVPS